MINAFFYVFLFSVFSISPAFGAEVIVKLKLSPAGSFQSRTSEVKGHAKKVGTKVVAEKVMVDLRNLNSGISLRDRHTQDHLLTDQFPHAIITNAEGEGGRGTGTISIKGIQKAVEGIYKVSGDELLARFKLKLSDFKISKIKYLGVGVNDEVEVTVKVPIK